MLRNDFNQIDEPKMIRQMRGRKGCTSHRKRLLRNRVDENTNKQRLCCTFCLLEMSWLSPDGRHRDIWIGVALGLSIAISSASVAAYVHHSVRRKQEDNPEPEFSARPIELRSDEIADGIAGLIGDIRSRL